MARLRAGCKGSGDPKRVVGAYITDVEVSEEQELAAGDARAQEAALAAIASPDDPVSAVLPDNPVETATAPADMFRASEGRWGSREVEITDVRLVGRGRRRRAISSTPATRLDVRISLRAPLPVDDFVLGIGIFNAEGVCCYGTNTSIEDLAPQRLAGDVRRSSRSNRSIWSKAPTSWTSRFTGSTATRTTITGCSTRFA